LPSSGCYYTTKGEGCKLRTSMGAAGHPEVAPLVRVRRASGPHVPRQASRTRPLRPLRSPARRPMRSGRYTIVTAFPNQVCCNTSTAGADVVWLWQDWRAMLSAAPRCPTARNASQPRSTRYEPSSLTSVAYLSQ